MGLVHEPVLPSRHCAAGMQVFDDMVPYVYLFASLGTGSITFVDTVLHSPCGGRDPRYVMCVFLCRSSAAPHGRAAGAQSHLRVCRSVLVTVLSPDADYVVQDATRSLYFRDSGVLRIYDSLNSGDVRLVNTTLQCYDPLTSPYVPPCAPHSACAALCLVSEVLA